MTRPSEEQVRPGQFPQGAEAVQSSTSRSLATAWMAARSEVAMSREWMEGRGEKRQRRRRRGSMGREVGWCKGGCNGGIGGGETGGRREG